MAIEARLKAIHELAKIPMKSEEETKRVEIIMLKFKEAPEVIDKAISRIVNHTEWPFKLTVYDNRLNTANTARIWNKLVKESTCQYVLLIDSDAFVPTDITPCWLTRMMESIKSLGIVVPVGDNVGGSNKALGPTLYPASQHEKGVWSGYCFLFTKRVWEAHPFDERFYIYGQDSAWAYIHAKYYGGAVVRKDVFVQHLGSYSFKKADAAGEVDREADKEYSRALFKMVQQGKL